MRKVPTSRAPDCTVQKYIGSAFDEVKIVADNIDDVKGAAQIADELQEIVPHLGDIEICADNIDAIKTAPKSAEAAAISAVASANSAVNADHSAIVAETAKTAAVNSAIESQTHANNAYNSASTAIAKAEEASISAATAQTAANKSEEIYEAFAKGAVYRGVWNIEVHQAYPTEAEHQNINSYWDVTLNEGTTEYTWGGIKWFSGDRLIYSSVGSQLQPDQHFYHVSRAAGVVSVNGESGSVTITLDKLTGFLDLQGSHVNTGISFRYSMVKGEVPDSEHLHQGEILINLADQLLYTKDHLGYVISIGGGGAGAGVPNFKVMKESTVGTIGEGHLFDCTTGSLMYIFPTGTAGKGDTVTVGDYGDSANLVTPLILHSTQKIHGQSEDIVITQPTRAVFQYVDDEMGWFCVDGIGEVGGTLPYEEVVIVPFTRATPTDRVVTLPHGYTWSSFEKIEFGIVDTDNPNATILATTVVDKEVITANPTSWFGYCDYSFVGANDKKTHVRLQAKDETSVAVLHYNTDQPSTGLAYIKGYTKYKPVLDWDVLLGQEEVVIFSNTLGGKTPATISLPTGYKWTDFEKIEFTTNHAGIEQGYNASILFKEEIAAKPTSWFRQIRYGDKATDYNITLKATSETTASTIYTNSAQFGIIKGYTKVKPTIEKVGSVTTLYDGNSVLNGADVTLSKSIEGFDAIRIYMRNDNNALVWSGTFNPSELLNPTTQRVHVASYYVGSTDYIRAGVDPRNNTATTLRVTSSQGTGGTQNVGIYKVEGINYNLKVEKHYTIVKGDSGAVNPPSTDPTRKETVLWEGNATTGQKFTTLPVTDFDEIIIEGYCPSVNYSMSKIVRPEHLIHRQRLVVGNWTGNTGQYARMELVPTSGKETTEFTSYFAGTVSSYAGGITKMVGVKYGSGSEAYPVGSCFLSMTADNPNTMLGYGTWSLVTGDASLSFGDGTARDGVVSGNNTPTVPLQQHFHQGFNSTRVAGNDTPNLNGSNYPSMGITNPTYGYGSYSMRASSNESNVGRTSRAGTTNATLDVRGARIAINVWQRTA